MNEADSWLDAFVQSPIWRGLPLGRRIPLIESAEPIRCAAGETLFEQFHPADTFYFLISGAVTQTVASETRTDLVQDEPIDWPMAAVGWSGFFSTRRFGATTVATADALLMTWPHERLAQLFYADPVLATRFFDLVLDSVRRQVEQLRQRCLSRVAPMFDPPPSARQDARRPVVAGPQYTLGRSAFFAPFDDAAIEALAAGAELASYAAGERIVQQGESVDGLLVLASGRCSLAFEQPDREDGQLLPFRRVGNRAAVIAGLPKPGTRFVAEATVHAESHCWIYRLPAASLDALMTQDPEFGRSLQQRLLVRMAGLVATMKVERDTRDADPEVAAVSNMLANSRARIPVSSQLHKVPHLLRHRLTVSNAFAVLRNVAATGRYHERLLASRCNDLAENLAAEDAFYQAVVAACQEVMTAEETQSPAEVRAACDRSIDSAFAHLDCRVLGREHLPKKTGNVFILNHLACPEYYVLPNDYHFSFDTAFVSTIVWQHFGKSAIRVVRESPGAEFGHNLFYQKLGHITVPTLESGVEGLSDDEFRRLRREASERFAKAGSRALASGENLIICPEGQSQPLEASPAKFHTGAFRLAQAANANVIPIAVSGFHQRFKDGPLVAVIGQPLTVPAEFPSSGAETLRQFVDALRDDFSVLVRTANDVAAQPARLSHPAEA